MAEHYEEYQCIKHDDFADLKAKCAVLHERCNQLETRCNKKDAKLEALQAFNNRVIGYAAAIAFAVSGLKDIFTSVITWN